MNDNTLRGRLTASGNLNATVNTIVYAHNYNDLTNKPKINNVTLQGNKTASDLGLVTPSDIPVTSVNEQTGDVELTGDNINYDLNTTVNAKINDLESQIVTSGVHSVNGQTGTVILTGANIDYSAGVSLSAKINAVEGEIPIVNYPVTSVNGETGAVVLAGSDIEYSEGVSISDQIDAVEGEIPSVDYPVTSVNGDTGDIVLTAQDIEMSSLDNTPVSTAIGDLSDLTTSVTSSLVGAVNEVVSTKANASDVYTKTQIDSVSTATVPATVGSGNVYYKVFGNLVIVWGLINTVSGIATGQAIITGLPRNMIGANNVIKAINNDGTSADWVLYQPNGNTSMLSSIAHTGTKSYTISFSYYTN